MYNYQQVYESSLEYFKGDELAASVFAGKYALQDSEGNYLESTPDDMHKRLAREFARIERKYPNNMVLEEIYQLFKDFKYVVPQGS
jgi:ribonucleoside-diphosphate reductase alpha chain